MKPSFEVCRQCPRFKDNLLDKKANQHAYDCLYKRETFGSLKTGDWMGGIQDAQIIFNKFFTIPKDCDFFLEHLVANDQTKP